MSAVFLTIAFCKYDFILVSPHISGMFFYLFQVFFWVSLGWGVCCFVDIQLVECVLVQVCENWNRWSCTRVLCSRAVEFMYSTLWRTGSRNPSVGGCNFVKAETFFAEQLLPFRVHLVLGYDGTVPFVWSLLIVHLDDLSSLTILKAINGVYCPLHHCLSFLDLVVVHLPTCWPEQLLNHRKYCHRRTIVDVRCCCVLLLLMKRLFFLRPQTFLLTCLWSVLGRLFWSNHINLFVTKLVNFI